MFRRGDAAYGPSLIDSSRRSVKQIVLWTKIIRSEHLAAQLTHFLVMAGLVPAIHVLDARKDVNARDKAGHHEL
jgi:hypothetical protein